MIQLGHECDLRLRDACNGRRSGELFSYIDLEAGVRVDHPLRSNRTIADEALGALSKDFAALDSGLGRL